jgi:hypothetical protein
MHSLWSNTLTVADQPLLFAAPGGEVRVGGALGGDLQGGIMTGEKDALLDGAEKDEDKHPVEGARTTDPSA